MKRLSLQWRITLLTAVAHRLCLRVHEPAFIPHRCNHMDALNGFMMQYQPGSEDSLTIEIPQEEMSSLLARVFTGSLRCKGGFWPQGLVHHCCGHHPQRGHRLFCPTAEL